jgi:hypothetical protein
MRQLRLLIISIATICAFALAAFALVGRPPVLYPGDDIIIKGGSIEIQCGKNHGNDCLGTNDSYGKYKGKNQNLHITKITIRDVKYPETVFYSGNFDKANPPQIEISYCEPGSSPGACKPRAKQ